jgi:hypothetical protein
VPAGLQVWDASGNLIFDTPDRIGRIVGSITTTAGSSGSVSFTVPSGCTPFWFSSTAAQLGGSPKVTISGGTISWSAAGETTIFYGYY